MDFLPLFCQLQQKPVLIVGGGEVAVRKARLLLDAKARVTINAPHLEPQLMSWAEQGVLTVCAADFHPELLDGKWLVIGARSSATWWTLRPTAAPSCPPSSTARR